MKKSFFIFSIAVASLGMYSCDSFLEVDPTQQIDQSASLSTSRDVEAYMVGCYDGLQGTNANGDTYAGGFQYTSELLGQEDNVETRFNGTFANLLELATKTTTNINSTAEGQWIRAYNVINRCNTVLSAIDKLDGAAKKTRIEGEALFIRGALYFELVRLYGKQWGDGDNAANPGVPLILTPTLSVTEGDFKKRNSVAEVYAQAIADLTKAEANLTAEDGTFTSPFATKGAAAGMLARVYLQQGNFTAARDAANRVLANTSYRLMSSFSNAFNAIGAVPAEYIFALRRSDQDGFNGMNTFFGANVSSVGGTGRGDIRVLAAHKALYDTLDTRGKFFVKTSATAAFDFTQKFMRVFGNVPVMRLAEMHLIRAECNFRLNTTVGLAPLAEINALRARAGAIPLTATTLNLDAILKERRLELAFEGHKLHDVKRTRGKVGTLDWNSNKLVLPVPQREIDVNKALTQNPGY
jgi:starch-binding outer membrane protein, SusD/RagB family